MSRCECTTSKSSLRCVDVREHLEVQVGCEVHQLLRTEPGAQRFAVGLQHRGRLRGLGGEQGDLVSLGHEAVAEAGDDPLGPAVRTRRDCLVERGDLRDPHDRAGDGRPGRGRRDGRGSDGGLRPPGTGGPSGTGRSGGRPDTPARPRRRPTGSRHTPGTAIRRWCSRHDSSPWSQPRPCTLHAPWRESTQAPARQTFTPSGLDDAPRCACEGGVVHSGRMSELHLSADTVPAGGRHDLVTVDGRSFAISGEGGDMAAPTHGLVYDDVRHLSRLRMGVTGGRVELLAASTPTPLSAVVVSRVTERRSTRPPRAGGRTPDDVAEVLLVRRRWLAGSLVEELTLRNSHAQPVTVHLELEVAADFAHVFDVKSGTGSGETARPESSAAGRWTLRSPLDPEDSTEIFLEPAPDESDPSAGTASLASAHRRRGRAHRHRQGAAGVGRRTRRPRAPLAAGQRRGDPGPGRVAHDGPDGRSPSTRGCPPRSTRRWPTWPPCASSTGSTPNGRWWPPVRRGS